MSGAGESHPTRILVSSSRKPALSINLVKRLLQEHGEVVLSGLGMAVASVVTVAEILKRRNLAVEKRVVTSLEKLSDGHRMRQKPKIEITMTKTAQFDEVLAAELAGLPEEDGPAQPREGSSSGNGNGTGRNSSGSRSRRRGGAPSAGAAASAAAAAGPSGVPGNPPVSDRPGPLPDGPAGKQHRSSSGSGSGSPDTSSSQAHQSGSAAAASGGSPSSASNASCAGLRGRPPQASAACSDGAGQ